MTEEEQKKDEQTKEEYLLEYIQELAGDLVWELKKHNALMAIVILSNKQHEGLDLTYKEKAKIRDIVNNLYWRD